MEILLLFEHNVGESLLIINTVSLLRGIDAHHHLNQMQLIYFGRTAQYLPCNVQYIKLITLITRRSEL